MSDTTSTPFLTRNRIVAMLTIAMLFLGVLVSVLSGESETPTVETPTVETPIVPAVETPTVETPTVETPSVEVGALPAEAAAPDLELAAEEPVK